MPYKDKAKRAENFKKYYEKHKGKILEKNRKWGQDNPDKRIAINERYYTKRATESDKYHHEDLEDALTSIAANFKLADQVYYYKVGERYIKAKEGYPKAKALADIEDAAERDRIGQTLESIPLTYVLHRRKVKAFCLPEDASGYETYASLADLLVSCPEIKSAVDEQHPDLNLSLNEYASVMDIEIIPPRGA